MTRLIPSLPFGPLTVLLVAATAFSVAASPADAQSRRELGERIDILDNAAQLTDDRLVRLEETLLTGDPAAVRLQERVDTLEGALTRLTGDLEAVMRDNRDLKEEVSLLRRQLQLGAGEFSGDFTGDLTGDPDAPTRLGGPTALGGGGGGVAESDPGYYGDDPFAAAKSQATGVLGTQTAVVLPNDPGQALEMAKGLLVRGAFADAEVAFAQLIATFPDAPQLGEALFWQGETHFLRDDFEAAKNLYIEALREAPKGPRAPDAMVKLAAALTKIGVPNEACRTLDAFDQTFPSADVAIRSKARRQREAAACT